MPASRALEVAPEAAGERLDTWIARSLPELSRARVQALLAQGAITVDGGAGRASQRVRAGQRVCVTVPDPEPAAPAAEDIPLAIVHEDGALLVLDKPAGLVVHPGAGARGGTLVNALLHHARDLSGVGGVLRPGIVHRLDRGTSGLLVVAKNDAAHRALAAQFAARTVRKEYDAIVHGLPAPRAGIIEAPIGRDPVHRRRMSVRAARARAARSDYRVAEALDGAALVRVRIHTGRTHQVRVHLAALGHPLVGDRTYGGGRTPSARSPEARTAIASFPRPALHAAALAFLHPATGAPLAFASPLPPDLADLLARLRPPAR